MCSVGCNLESKTHGSKSRFLFLFEDVLLITKFEFRLPCFPRLTAPARSDEKRAWDQGAYLILARLDLIDVSVHRESEDVFLIRVDGVGDQRFQMRDRQHMSDFLDKLQAARAVRRASSTPRSDSEAASPSPSPLQFRREHMWPRGTLVGQAMEEDVSEEFDARINSQADLVEMVRRAYASDGFLTFPRSFVAVKTDSAGTALALDAMRKAVKGTPLESPDLNRAQTLEEATNALQRIFQLTDAQKSTLAAFNTKKSTTTAAESAKLAARAEKAEADKKALEDVVNRTRAEFQQTRIVLEERLSKLERDNALLDMKAADAEDRARLAEDGLAKAASRLEDAEAMLDKERSKGAVLKEMLNEQQQQQQPKKALVNRTVESVQLQMTKRSSKLVLEANTPQPDSNSSMADFSIAEEDLDSILGEFVASPEERALQSASLSAGDRTLRDVQPAQSASSKSYETLLQAVNTLTSDQQLGYSDESNAVRNLERVRYELKRLRDEVEQVKRERQATLKAVEVQLDQAKKDKQSADTAFRMAEAVATAAKQEAAMLRSEKKALEQQLEGSKKETQVLRESSHHVADTTAAANKNESQLKTELREAQRENRRLQAELDETQSALKTAQTIAADATDRARQERTRGSSLMRTRTEEESHSLSALQAKAAAEELRKLVQRHEALRKQLGGTLSTLEMQRMATEHGRELDAALRAVEAPLGIAAPAAAAGSVKSPRGQEVSAEVRLQTMRVEAARLEASMQAMSSELVEERDKLKAERVARTEAERLVGIEKARVAFLEKRVDELTHEVRVARDETAAANARREREVGAEKRAASELEQKLRDASEGASAKVAALERQWAEAEKAAHLRAAAADKPVEAGASAMLQAKQSEVEDLRGDVEDLQGELVAIKAQLSAALGACTKLRQEKGELMTKVEKLSSTVKDLLKHSNEQASELKLEKSRSASLRASPKMSPRSPAAVDASPETQLTDVMSQLRAANEKVETAERRANNLAETNKALLSRLNELQKKK